MFQPLRLPFFVFERLLGAMRDLQTQIEFVFIRLGATVARCARTYYVFSNYQSTVPSTPPSGFTPPWKSSGLMPACFAASAAASGFC